MDQRSSCAIEILQLHKKIMHLEEERTQPNKFQADSAVRL
jgi:hypothetical protein